MFSLTTFAASLNSHPSVVALKAFAESPIGENFSTARETIARLVALDLLVKAPNGALPDLSGVYGLLVAGAATYKAYTKALDQAGLLDDKGVDHADAVLQIHGHIYDVFEGKKLHVTEIPPGSVPALKSKGTKVKPSIPAEPAEVAAADKAAINFPLDNITPLTFDQYIADGNDKLRVFTTRSLEHFAPEAYAQYRQLKDSGEYDAKQKAYTFAWSAFRRLIGVA